MTQNGLVIDEHGNKSWWLNGVLHREDGPAVEWVNGHRSWWINGIQVQRIKIKKSALQNLRSCPGPVGSTCPERNWIKKGHRRCEKCAEENRKQNKVVVVDKEKLLNYLKSEDKSVQVKENKEKLQKTLNKLKVDVKKKIYIK